MQLGTAWPNLFTSRRRHLLNVCVRSSNSMVQGSSRVSSTPICSLGSALNSIHTSMLGAGSDQAPHLHLVADLLGLGGDDRREAAERFERFEA